MTSERGIRAIVLDVEGTTAPIDFVYSTLFPYARRRLESFLAAHWDESAVRDAVNGLVLARASEVEDAPAVVDESGGPSVSSVTAFAHWLMDRDRKTTPLKALQGLIWEEGYDEGELESVVFDDVAPAFERWTRGGVRIASYSSGSVRAQQLLYGNTTAGDLTRFVESYFDTTTGAKAEPSSYERIVAALGLEPDSVLFVSDVVSELEAAEKAGLRTLLAVRPGNRSQPRADEYETVSDFDQILGAPQ